MATPIRDNLLWFGDGLVNKDDWIYVYTGPGEARSSLIPNTNSSIFTIRPTRYLSADA